MSDDENNLIQEEKMKMYRERLKQVVEKHDLEVDIERDNAEEAKNMDKTEGKEMSKGYLNPFKSERMDDDFNDKDSDFNTDDIILKPKSKPKNQSKIQIEGQNTHQNEERNMRLNENIIDLEIADEKSKINVFKNNTNPEVEMAKTLNTDEEQDLEERIQKVLNSEHSENIAVLQENDQSPSLIIPDIEEEQEEKELTYNDILKKYEVPEVDISQEVEIMASSDGLKNFNNLDSSGKLVQDKILEYRQMLEKSQKEDEEALSFRKSLESERFKYNLTASYADKDLSERNFHDVNRDTLDYSPTSRKDSEMKVMDTEMGETYRSLNDSFKRIDDIIKSSPRVEEIKEVREKSHASPLSSRRSSNSKQRRRSESPSTQTKILGSPSENKNIVYDQFVNLRENTEISKDNVDLIKAKNTNSIKIDSRASKNDISPLRVKNLAENGISYLQNKNNDI